MSGDGALSAMQQTTPTAQGLFRGRRESSRRLLLEERPNCDDPILRAARCQCSGLLVLSILLAAYSAAWEYITRWSSTGFRDAVAPEPSVSWLGPGRAGAIER